MLEDNISTGVIDYRRFIDYTKFLWMSMSITPDDDVCFVESYMYLQFPPNILSLLMSISGFPVSPCGVHEIVVSNIEE
jgi:hypothetical protein